MGQQVHVYRELIMHPGAIVTGSFGHDFDRGGRTYYVNNITGSSTADGLSWNSAMDEPSTAITASETFRELQASTNERIRNTIVVQATDTAYTGLADLGEELNLIGLAPPTGGRGYLCGAEIGNATRNGVTTATTNGLYIANIQFSAQVSNTPVFNVVTIDQSCIEDCSFEVDNAAALQATDAISITTGANGLVLRRCRTGTNAGAVARCIDGFHHSGTIFRNSLVEQCHFCGSSKAFHIASTCIYDQGTMVWWNYFGDYGMGQCVYGIYDQSTGEDTTGGQITYVNNFIDATNPIDSAATATTRFVMNYAGTAVISTFA